MGKRNFVAIAGDCVVAVMVMRDAGRKRRMLRFWRPAWTCFLRLRSNKPSACCANNNGLWRCKCKGWPPSPLRKMPRPLLYLQLLPGCESAPENYSVQQDSYAQELAFDKRRTRHRRVGQRLRTLAMIVLIPLGLAAIFLVSYALTCILNGASPSEVLQHLSALGQRLGDVITTIRAGWES